MLPKDIKKKGIGLELCDSDLKKWFNYKRDKVIHNIDTLYVTVTVNEDYYANRDFLLYLEGLKNRVTFEALYISEYDVFFKSLSFVNYKYCFEKEDEFLIFFSGKKTLEGIPPIFVQVRSQFLWLNGEYKAMQLVDEFLIKFLRFFGFTIQEYKENRLDFAYHSNYIKNMSLFYRNLNNMQVSHFKRWHKEGVFSCFEDDGGDDYLAIGQRRSNNIFIRTYNKTKEVIENGYKQFFISYWKETGLISNFDMYVYEKCFEKKRYEYIDIARLEFYLEYGKNNEMIKIVDAALHDKNVDDVEIRKLADMLVPRVNIITNFEFQTKRKFYYSLDKALGSLPCITETVPRLARIYRIFDNKICIHKVLTEDVFRLVDEKANYSRKREKPVLPYWELIQKCDMNSKVESVKLHREYQRNLDIESIKRSLVNKISVFSLYVDKDNKNDIYEDSSTFLSYLNENDIQKAEDYKNKKVAVLKNRLDKLEKKEKELVYKIVDVRTGTII